MFYLDGWVSAPECFFLIYDQMEEQVPGSTDESLDKVREEFWNFCWTLNEAGILLPNGQEVRVDRFFLRTISRHGSNHESFDYRTGIVTFGEARVGVGFRMLHALSIAALRAREEPTDKEHGRRSQWILIFTFVLLVTGYTSLILALVSFGLWVPWHEVGREVAIELAFAGSVVLVAAYVLLTRLLPHKATTTLAPKPWGGFSGGSLMFRKKDVVEYLDRPSDEVAGDGSVAAVANRIIADCRRGYFPRKADAATRHAPPGMSHRAFLAAWEKARELYPELSKPGNWKSKQ
ncbi:hypothetical protein [Aliiruegeria sabulilitoris]|uniref:hypothetical protein n=1 Tax=Aliiruegeria sabulilitoris TaxID=1510458 RepID=UPI0008324757|nr:hypothetical protein [Aliiruegeria sabulilitoris]NDR59200.1 hypothetical protein [Pseudoruegeria sp. M32A2M]